MDFIDLDTYNLINQIIYSFLMSWTFIKYNLI